MKQIIPTNLFNNFVTGYLITALFSEENTELTIYTVHADYKAEVEERSKEFLDEVILEIGFDETIKLLEIYNEEVVSPLGSDFYYVRFGHGVGYLDRNEFNGHEKTLYNIATRFNPSETAY